MNSRSPTDSATWSQPDVPVGDRVGVGHHHDRGAGERRAHLGVGPSERPLHLVEPVEPEVLLVVAVAGGQAHQADRGEARVVAADAEHHEARGERGPLLERLGTARAGSPAHRAAAPGPAGSRGRCGCWRSLPRSRRGRGRRRRGAAGRPSPPRRSASAGTCCCRRRRCRRSRWRRPRRTCRSRRAPPARVTGRPGRAPRAALAWSGVTPSRASSPTTAAMSAWVEEASATTRRPSTPTATSTSHDPAQSDATTASTTRARGAGEAEDRTPPRHRRPVAGEPGDRVLAEQRQRHRTQRDQAHAQQGQRHDPEAVAEPAQQRRAETDGDDRAGQQAEADHAEPTDPPRARHAPASGRPGRRPRSRAGSRRSAPRRPSRARRRAPSRPRRPRRCRRTTRRGISHGVPSRESAYWPRTHTVATTTKPTKSTSTPDRGVPARAVPSSTATARATAPVRSQACRSVAWQPSPPPGHERPPSAGPPAPGGLPRD